MNPICWMFASFGQQSLVAVVAVVVVLRGRFLSLSYRRAGKTEEQFVIN